MNKREGHPHLPMPIRSDAVDKYYAVLGRALAYATDYENNCKKLAHILDIDYSHDDFEMKIFMKEKGKLHGNIEII